MRKYTEYIDSQMCVIGFALRTWLTTAWNPSRANPGVTECTLSDTFMHNNSPASAEVAGSYYNFNSIKRHRKISSKNGRR